jgi:hypothetical protein
MSRNKNIQKSSSCDDSSLFPPTFPLPSLFHSFPFLSSLLSFFSRFFPSFLSSFSLFFPCYNMKKLPLFCSFRSSTSTARPFLTAPTSVGSTLTKAAVLRVNLNLDRVPITSRTHTHPSLTNHSSINLISIFRCSSSARHPVYARRVDPSPLVFSLSSRRHSYIGLLFRSRFIIS